MTTNEDFSSFCATSLMDFKSQSPKRRSKVVAPTAEERRLLNYNSYGTFAIPYGAFRRHSDDAATSFYRHDSVIEEGNANHLSIVSAVNVSTSTSSSEDSADTLSSASSARGLTSCRQSYATYNGGSTWGGRWGSGAYHFENSGRAPITAKTYTATSSVPLPVMPAMPAMPDVQAVAVVPQSPKRLCAVKPIRTVHPPTPPPIEVDFSGDNDDELLPDENKTQQFFRLALQHRNRRVRLMEQRESGQKPPRRARVRPQVVLSNKKSAFSAALAAVFARPLPKEKKRVMLPTPPRAPQSPQQRPDRSRYASLSTAKPDSQQAHRTDPPSDAPATATLRAPHLRSRNGAPPFAGQMVDYAWEMDNFHKPALAVAAAAEVTSSNASSESSSTSSDSDAEPIPAEERELWGVCPQRDFPLVRSPVWAALDNPRHHDGSGENAHNGSSAAPDGDDDRSSSDSSSEDEDDEEVGVVFASSPSFAVAMHTERSTPLPGEKPTARSEVAMYALKMHRSPEMGLTVNSSHGTANSTDCLSDSSSSSSKSSSGSSSSSMPRGSCKGAAPNQTRQRADVALQPPQQHGESTTSRRERNGARVIFRPRAPEISEAMPIVHLRYRRPNGFRRMFNGKI
ncbi:hypothetical protein ABB37_06008 [Leptomonas pyrrhocoris]|uniref:Uncharacterized protein n=1 Tax=Leptomonas pyrrhocoris TaxID=157538 RepID=A0A0N0VEQ8_LEPPY|nr:hypothetical protein ABB37_06008 [Leptomonas pyrrhocoris]KPA78944.1 hypothetical protein ABB37_06008 [Leptomonas pyrrhocoris]|eukprot:XP_015657383.1 hypothetical protein ABB37_06008 [Leptomonas pyrrhocoris]